MLALSMLSSRHDAAQYLTRKRDRLPIRIQYDIARKVINELLDRKGADSYYNK